MAKKVKNKEKVVKEKKVKEKVVKEKVVKAKKQSGKVGLFNIRNKIFACFILPIIFMIIVGVTSYEKAVEGMSSKFRDTSAQTVNMGVEYMDVVCSNIQTVASGYISDADFESYVVGMPGQDKLAKAQYYSHERVNLMAAQMTNPFINNIHLVTKPIVHNMSTATADKIDGIFEEYKADIAAITGNEKSLPRWITSHPLLDETFGLKPAETFLTYQVLDKSTLACIIVDINKNQMGSILSNIDFGAGSYVGIITEDGKELALQCGTEELLDGTGVFTGESFYSSAAASEDIVTILDVSYKNQGYLFIAQKSELNGLMLCALIPSATITGQAESIKTTTFALVIIAAIIAFAIGTVIANGIQKNMKSISKKLDEVAKGDLTVSVEAKGNDEFQGLARSATNMVSNNKNLVLRLNGTASELENSAQSVNAASGDISTYSNQITQAIDEISVGMDKQSEHATECVEITNGLSEKIGVIIKEIGMMEQLISDTEELIGEGTDIVDRLNDRAEQTSNITSEVAVSIDKLKDEADSIAGFVDTINSIANKTNLLSLNASIEAARAGDAGRGFAVVAEEIRVLADNSKGATVEIENKIKDISAQTDESVSSVTNAEHMVSLSKEAANEVNVIFGRIREHMNKLAGALNAISDSATDADNERKQTVDAVDNISAIIQQTAANSSLVKDMAENLLTSVDRLGETADNLDNNMNGLKTEIASFTVE